MELECLAVVDNIKHFEAYLYGRETFMALVFVLTELYLQHTLQEWTGQRGCGFPLSPGMD